VARVGGVSPCHSASSPREGRVASTWALRAEGGELVSLFTHGARWCLPVTDASVVTTLCSRERAGQSEQLHKDQSCAAGRPPASVDAAPSNTIPEVEWHLWSLWGAYGAMRRQHQVVAPLCCSAYVTRPSTRVVRSEGCSPQGCAVRGSPGAEIELLCIAVRGGGLLDYFCWRGAPGRVDAHVV
jgi:hypothetical protein